MTPTSRTAWTSTEKGTPDDRRALLDRRTFFVKEHIGVLRLTDAFDLLDPETKERVGVAREEPSFWSKYLRLIVKKALLPTTVRVYEREDQPPVLTLDKPFALLQPRITVRDGNGNPLGCFKSKLFALGGGFWVHDVRDQRVAEVKGDWKGWNFKMASATGEEFGTVTKKWGGIGKELFTSADNYIIDIAERATGQDILCALLLAAGLAIDMIFKERK